MPDVTTTAAIDHIGAQASALFPGRMHVRLNMAPSCFNDGTSLTLLEHDWILAQCGRYEHPWVQLFWPFSAGLNREYVSHHLHLAAQSRSLTLSQLPTLPSAPVADC
ncbi:unnamed protein product [Calypogeia fissa]